MSPVKIRCCNDLTTSLHSYFMLLAENLLLLVEFLYGKRFQMLKKWANTPSLKFASPDALALELEADLVESLVKVPVSILEKFKTVIIHLDIVDVDTP